MSEDAPSPDSPQPPRPPARWLDRHLWQIQPVRDLLMIAAAVGIFWLGYKLSIVTVPLLLAITFAYLFEPVIKRMTRISWMSRQGASAAIIGLSVLVVIAPIVIGLAFATIQGVQLAGDVAETATSIKAAVDNPENGLAQDRVRGRIPIWIRDQILQAQTNAEADAEGGVASSEEAGAALQVALTWIGNNAQAVTQRALQTGANAFDAFFRTVTSIIYIGFTLFLTAFFFFFIASGYGEFLEFSSKFIPEAHRDRTLDLLQKFDAVISGFVRGRLTIAFIQSIVFTLGYWFIGVPAPVLLGVGVAVLSIVPYAALVGIPISIILLWIEPHTGFQGAIWWTVGAPVVLYFVGQALDDYVWTPLIQGKSTGMDTPTILFATLAGGALMGIYGLLLAIPLAACLKIILQEIVWPRFQEWIAGKRKDFLPISDEA